MFSFSNFDLYCGKWGLLIILIGFLNVDRLEAPIPIWLIFQHSPEKFHERLKKLLKIENDKGRLPDGEYAVIYWHLNGRKNGTPFKVKTLPKK